MDNNEELPKNQNINTKPENDLIDNQGKTPTTEADAPKSQDTKTKPKSKSNSEKKLAKETKSRPKDDLPPLPPPPSKRSPASAMVWLLIMVAIGVLLVMKTGFGDSAMRKISQSEFEELLKNQQIISAKTSAESDRIMNINGKMRLTPPTPTVADGKTVDDVAKKDNIVRYRTRIIYSEKVDEMLRAADVSRDVETRENWWNALITLIPIILIIGLILLFIFPTSKNGWTRGNAVRKKQSSHDYAYRS